MYSIGELSQATGVKVPTIRYYEGIGLLEAEGRTGGNQRRYGRAGLDRLTFIRHGRDLGLSLDAIRALLDLDPADHGKSHAIAEAHLADVRARVARLRRLEAELVRIVAACDGAEAHTCNILEAFGDHDACETEHG
ncbi:helix-turn-helix domain-containing protein [Maritimibacter sp. UBA3975]|uniref:MerR family transcriptional regulator n=1 Tax=Maritimibacter sp. UBA3975 TaxID=1946833 RepID=UPI000C0A300D|nr:helix-turn-helix domain-containing protein [Maritimibacter sp. UBA3975]MAM62057.1 transcriptional regulator [Maritimibacter sp.]|tara:strand:- start:15538 stop:15945 length:408 start_codon:yes stop_codon:yes gene_type:complete